MVIRGATPGCNVDWSRLHTLPVGVPPDSLSPADRVTYMNGLAASGQIPLSTYDRFFTTPPKFGAVRRTPLADGMRHLLPRHSQAPGDDLDLPAGASSLVTRTFSTTPPNAGTPKDVEDQLQSKLPHDDISRKFTPLPIPLRDLDTLLFYFAPQAAPPFAGTLGTSDPGVFGGETPLPAALPNLLLTTRTVGGVIEIGELDRLLLRAPVTGRFRFEPYYHYRWNGSAFEVIGPSNSGRLLVQQPDLSTLRRDAKTMTQVFATRTFAFDHVARDTVVTHIRHSLALQFAFLSGLMSAHKGEAGAPERLAIHKSAPEVMSWVLTGVNSMLRAWTAFLSVLKWRPEDTTVAGAIPNAWFAGFPERQIKIAEAKTLIAAVDQLRGQPAWIESLLFFLENVLARKIAGFTWTEVLQLNGQDPAVRRFPVHKDQPPYTPKDNAAIKQHARLRLVDDPQYRWTACYAGTPLGKPSPMYASAPSGTTAPPAGGLTTYELEALHDAGTAHTVLGLGAPVAGAGTQPGQAMSPAPYATKASGHACFFTAGRSGLHTTVDWLLELTQGIHFHVDEAGFIDPLTVMDPATGGGHPLLAPLHFDEHNRATHLRRQMDAVAPTTFEDDSLAWWDGRLGFPKTGGKWDADNLAPSPRAPYQVGRTSRPFARAAINFDTLIFGNPSGFDTFDIESAYLATGRISKPTPGGSPPARLPLAVLLALMEREGVKVFAPLNRYAVDTTDETKTMRWEARRTFADPVGPFERSDYGGPLSEVAREAWLSYPYGLDTYATFNTAAGTDGRVTGTAVNSGALDLEPGESIGGYVRDRVWCAWVPTPAVGATRGVPRIWKRSRRAHWACLALMVSYYRHIELEMHNAASTVIKDTASWDRTDWLPAGSSPPDLTGKGPLDVEWKDYLTYYGMLYIGHNGGPGTLVDFLEGVTTARPSGSALSHRDWLIFQHRRDNSTISRMARFVIGLDAFMRLNYMEGAAPSTYAAATADTTAPGGRTWVTAP